MLSAFQSVYSPVNPSGPFTLPLQSSGWAGLFCSASIQLPTFLQLVLCRGGWLTCSDCFSGQFLHSLGFQWLPPSRRAEEWRPNCAYSPSFLSAGSLQADLVLLPKATAAICGCPHMVLSVRLLKTAPSPSLEAWCGTSVAAHSLGTAHPHGFPTLGHIVVNSSLKLPNTVAIFPWEHWLPPLPPPNF